MSILFRYKGNDQPTIYDGRDKQFRDYFSWSGVEDIQRLW